MQKMHACMHAPYTLPTTPNNLCVVFRQKGWGGWGIERTFSTPCIIIKERERDGVADFSRFFFFPSLSLHHLNVMYIAFSCFPSNPLLDRSLLRRCSWNVLDAMLLTEMTMTISFFVVVLIPAAAVTHRRRSHRPRVSSGRMAMGMSATTTATTAAAAAAIPTTAAAWWHADDHRPPVPTHPRRRPAVFVYIHHHRG